MGIPRDPLRYLCMLRGEQLTYLAQALALSVGANSLDSLNKLQSPFGLLAVPYHARQKLNEDGHALRVVSIYLP